MSDPYLLGIACDGDCRQDGCPKCGYTLGIGDPIEIRTIQRSPFQRTPDVTWLPATITHVSDNEIGVAFSDGSRLALPRRSGGTKQWRTGR